MLFLMLFLFGNAPMSVPQADASGQACRGYIDCGFNEVCYKANSLDEYGICIDKGQGY